MEKPTLERRNEQGPSETREPEEETSLTEAKRIMGEDLIGPADVEKVFGKPETVPPIQFSKEELERAKELGQQLILYTDTLQSAKLGETAVPLTLESLRQNFTEAHDGKRVFWEKQNSENEDFFTKETPRIGWRLTSKELIPESTSKDYLEQTDLLIEYLQTQVFKGTSLPEQYEHAIAEYKSKRAEIQINPNVGVPTLIRPETKIQAEERERASRILADLTITKLTRELPIEVMYRLILNDRARRQKLLPDAATSTAGFTSGWVVSVGPFNTSANGNKSLDDSGVPVIEDPFYLRDHFIGTTFSRS